ncbi:unnamed protein product [Periconia digitata]|uniref:Peptidase A1 domain-containing protein n=1 Tax=Periconia digitata TaxID=1303443 RepID=A0A9W4XTE2_9PLEO|nr:unnamed protein product [Periconia digitata]
MCVYFLLSLGVASAARKTMFFLPVILLLSAKALSQTIQLDFVVQELKDGHLPLSSRLHARNIELPVFNDFPTQRYLFNIMAGNPPQSFTIMIDSGSADLWLPSPTSPGCLESCPPGTFDVHASGTAVDIHIPYNVSFGLTPDNIMLGEYYNDTVTIGGATLLNQSFAVAEVTEAEMIHWGIMGLGTVYRSSAYDNPKSPTYRSASRSPLPVWLNLHRQGIIEKKIFSVWLNSQDAATGTLLLGGIDDAKYEGELKSTPVLLSGPEQVFMEWLVQFTSVARVDNEGKREDLTASNWTLEAIVDTGSPNMYLPSSLYDSIASPLNATTHPTANTPYVPCSLRSSSEYLEWVFAGRDEEDGPAIRMPYSEMIYSFGMPANLGEVRSEDGVELCYLGVIPWDGPIVLVGAVLIRNAYVVFDGEAVELRMAQVKID